MQLLSTDLNSEKKILFFQFGLLPTAWNIDLKARVLAVILDNEGHPLLRSVLSSGTRC